MSGTKCLHVAQLPALNTTSLSGELLTLYLTLIAWISIRGRLNSWRTISTLCNNAEVYSRWIISSRPWCILYGPARMTPHNLTYAPRQGATISTKMPKSLMSQCNLSVLVVDTLDPLSYLHDLEKLYPHLFLSGHRNMDLKVQPCDKPLYPLNIYRDYTSYIMRQASESHLIVGYTILTLSEPLKMTLTLPLSLFDEKIYFSKKRKVNKYQFKGGKPTSLLLRYDCHPLHALFSCWNIVKSTPLYSTTPYYAAYLFNSQWNHMGYLNAHHLGKEDEA